MRCKDYLYDFLPYVGVGLIVSERLRDVFEGVNANFKTHPVSVRVLSTGEVIDTYRLIVITDFLPIVNKRKSVFQMGREKIYSLSSDMQSPLFRDKERKGLIFVNQLLADELNRFGITGYELSPVLL